MRLFTLPDGKVDGRESAQWLTPPFDWPFAATPVGAPAAEVGRGPPILGAPWHAARRPIAEASALTASPPQPAPLPQRYAPEIHGGPGIAAPWHGGRRFQLEAWWLEQHPQPQNVYAPEVSWGPFTGAPWHGRRRPEAEDGRLVQAPVPAPPSSTTFPEFAGGPPMRGAPWLLRLPLTEGMRGSPGTGIAPLPEARPGLLLPRVNRVIVGSCTFETGVDPQLPGIGRPAQNPGPPRPRVPADRRLGRFSEEVQSILNSLLDGGYIRLVSSRPLRYQVIAGGLSGAGPPGADTDRAAGAIAGCCYIDTTAGRVYFCADATIGAAVWRGPF